MLSTDPLRLASKKRSPEKSYFEAAKAERKLQQTEDETNYSSYAHPKLLSYILQTGLKVEDRHRKLR